MKVYGCRISYYTGKLESYLRYRGIPYTSLPTEPHRRRLLQGAGVVQMPVVELADGRWMTDTTPILLWLDGEEGTSLLPAGQPVGPSILPEDPVLRFAALLVEDWADEYLWRAAMHYRWSYPRNREYASAAIVDEVLVHMRLPRFWKRRLVERRQLHGFVLGDGVRLETRGHVERGYLVALDLLEAIFEGRRFVLGARPSLADFGLMGPMLRHFGQDPGPQEIMRERASGVYAWVARVWNTKVADATGPLVPGLDPPLVALLREACETHLVQLRENARAFAQGLSRYDQTLQGCAYRQVPVSRYRVWCLERLRAAWAGLDAPARETLRAHLPEAEAAVLWQDDPAVASGYDVEGRAPFNRGINVFGRGVPPR